MDDQPSFNLALLAILFSGLLFGCAGRAGSLHGSPYEPPQPAPSLDLQTTSGDPFVLSAYADEILMVYFGYTYCPDVCPTTLADVKIIFEELGERSNGVHLVMVTVDPERDHPATLENYLGKFHPDFIGLYGEGHGLEKAMSAYGVFAQKEPSDDPDRYFVSHTARLFIIDKQGLLRTNYPFGTPRDEIRADLELLLKEE